MSKTNENNENVLTAMAENAAVDDAIRKAADERGVVRAEQLRRLARRWYDRLASEGLDWRDRVRELGFTPASDVPRGYWSSPETIVDVIQRVASDLGRSPTRQDLVDAGYGSANARLDEHFGGIDNALRAAGLPPAAASGRPDGWIDDEDEVRLALEEYVDEEGMLPKASRIRECDSSLEALLRARHGSWEQAAEYYGFLVRGARQKWATSKLEAALRAAQEGRAVLSRRDVRRLLSPGYVRAVERRYGSLAQLQIQLGFEVRGKLLAPQGFPVDSVAEWRVATLLHWTETPVFRTRLTIEGRHVYPDFVVPTSEGPLIIEVLMVGEGDKARSDKEADYQARWEQKKSLYESAGLRVLTIEPSEVANAEALLARLQATCGGRTVPDPDRLQEALAELAPYTPPVWTWELIDSEVRRVADLNDGYMPTQSMLRSFGRPGLLNVITRRGHTLASMQERLGLPSKPKAEES